MQDKNLDELLRFVIPRTYNKISDEEIEQILKQPIILSKEDEKILDKFDEKYVRNLIKKYNKWDMKVTLLLPLLKRQMHQFNAYIPRMGVASLELAAIRLKVEGSSTWASHP